MKRGDSIEVEISALSSRGNGVTWKENCEIWVPRAVPGDRVEVRIRRKRKGRFEAEIERFRSCGALRKSAPCRHFGICGGCRWQELAYADQLRLKEEMVFSALRGKNYPLPCVLPILPSPRIFFYRNKMEFSFGRTRDGVLLLGLHAQGRYNHLFNVEGCLLQSELSNRIVSVVRRCAVEEGLSVYDLKTHEGLLRFLVIREARKTGELMVNLVVSDYPCDAVDRLVDEVVQEVPEVDTFVVTLHRGKAQVAVGEREFVLSGKGSITEECGGLEYEISPHSFFQTNSLQAERLYETVLDMSGGLDGAEVLDLYCGTGGISLHLARSAEKVWGIEQVKAAVEDARRNAERNQIGNCIFRVGSAEEVIQHFETGRFDLAVVDPPRAGIHKRALAALSTLGIPAIVYVSCNPISMADDMEVLCQAGYRIEQIKPVDMFPQTPHCEIVARLVMR